jgi:hypothetical protein
VTVVGVVVRVGTGGGDVNLAGADGGDGENSSEGGGGLIRICHGYFNQREKRGREGTYLMRQIVLTLDANKGFSESVCNWFGTRREAITYIIT